MESIQHKNIMEKQQLSRNICTVITFNYANRQLLFSVNIIFFHAVFPGINLKIKSLNTTGIELI